MTKYIEIKGHSIQSTDTDPALYAGAWASTPALNTAKVAAATGGTSTAMIVAGGYDGTTPGDAAHAETYDGSSWTEVGDLNTARQNLANGIGASSTAVLAVAGGTPPYGITHVTNVESWNGSSWTETTDVNTARDHGGGAGTNTSGLLAGGRIQPNVSDLVESWDGSSWTESTEINTARKQAKMIGVSNTAALIVAGVSATADVAIVESWNGSSWTETGDINTARDNVGLSGTSSLAIAYGGHSSTFVANTEHFDGSAWTEVADLAGARSGNSTTPAGTAYAAVTAGGSNPSDPGVTTTGEEWTVAHAFKKVTTS